VERKIIMTVNSVEKSITPVGTTVALASGAVLGAGAHYFVGGGSNASMAKNNIAGGLDTFVKSEWDRHCQHLVEQGYSGERLASAKEIFTKGAKDRFDKLSGIVKKYGDKRVLYVAAGAAIVGGAYLLIKKFANNKKT
jgi:hypothetical protein